MDEFFRNLERYGTLGKKEKRIVQKLRTGKVLGYNLVWAAAFGSEIAQDLLGLTEESCEELLSQNEISFSGYVQFLREKDDVATFKDVTLFLTQAALDRYEEMASWHDEEIVPYIEAAQDQILHGDCYRHREERQELSALLRRYGDHHNIRETGSLLLLLDSQLGIKCGGHHGMHIYSLDYIPAIYQILGEPGPYLIPYLLGDVDVPNY